MDLMSWWPALDRVGYETVWVLVTVLWQSSILLAAAGLIAWALRRRRPSVRHVLWAAALLAAPLLPLLGWIASNVDAPQAEIPVMPDYPAHRPPAEWAEPVVAPSEPALPMTPALPIAPAAKASTEPAPTQAEEPFSVLAYPWALALLAYAAGAGALLALVLAGRLRIAAWIRGGRVVTDREALAVFRSAKRRLGQTGDVLLVESDHVRTPMAVGLLRPVVLLPAGFVRGLSASELEAVALHELAHIKRRDPLVLTVLSLVRAALFFHPLVWLACRQVSRLAEAACDDAVLDATAEPVSYAKLLARLAEALPRRAVATELASGFVLSKGAFLARIRAILSDRRDQIRRFSRIALAVTALACVISVILALALPLGEKEAPNSDQEPSAAPAARLVSGEVDLKDLEEHFTSLGLAAMERHKEETGNPWVMTLSDRPEAAAAGASLAGCERIGAPGLDLRRGDRAEDFAAVTGVGVAYLHHGRLVPLRGTVLARVNLPAVEPDRDARDRPFVRRLRRMTVAQLVAQIEAAPHRSSDAAPAGVPLRDGENVAILRPGGALYVAHVAAVKSDAATLLPQPIGRLANPRLVAGRPALELGPVREAAIPPRPRSGANPEVLLDFETATVAELPPELHDDWIEDERERWQWKRGNGFDLSVIAYWDISLLAQDAALVEADNAVWNEVTASDLQGDPRLKRLGGHPFHVPAEEPLPRTFLFRTREGAWGQMRLAERLDGGGVRVLYRLAGAPGSEGSGPPALKSDPPDLVGAVLTPVKRSFAEDEPLHVKQGWKGLNWRPAVGLGEGEHDLPGAFDKTERGRPGFKHWQVIVNGEAYRFCGGLLTPNPALGPVTLNLRKDLVEGPAWEPGTYRVQFVARDLPVVRLDDGESTEALTAVTVGTIASNEVRFEIVPSAADGHVKLIRQALHEGKPEKAKALMEGFSAVGQQIEDSIRRDAAKGAAAGSTEREPPERVGGGGSFGPVIERVVKTEREGSDFMIDLDSGRLATPPEDLVPDDTDPDDRTAAEMAAGFTWLTEQGIDALAMRSGTLEGLLGMGLRAAHVHETLWRTATPQQVAEAVGEGPGEGPPQVVINAANGARTFAFRTREGGTGILQITGFSDKPEAVRIRYKLVQGAAAEGAAEVAASRAVPVSEKALRGYPFAQGWPLALPGSVVGTPAAADLDGDGDLEIVVPCWDAGRRRAGMDLVHPEPSPAAQVFAFHHDGRPVEGWPVVLVDAGAVRADREGRPGYAYDWASAPSIMDLDGDGQDDIVLIAPCEAGLRLISGTGRVLETPRGGGDPWAPMPLIDLEGDGIVDLVSRGILTSVRGTPIPGWPAELMWEYGFAPCVGDADGDGEPEFYYPSYVHDNQIGGYDAHGHPLPGWPQKVGRQCLFPPAMGDVTGDGRMDVVATDQFGLIHVWTWDGRPVPGAHAIERRYRREAAPDEGKYVTLQFNSVLKEGIPGYASMASPTLADLDGDGTAEIVVFDGKALRAWHGDGRPVAGEDGVMARLPLATIEVRIGDGAASETFHPIGAGVTVADLGDDGMMDLFVGSYWVRLAKDGSAKVTEMLPKPAPCSTASTITDLDGDGRAEVVFGLLDGRLFVYETREACRPAWMQWPTANGNFRRTGAWRRPDRGLLVRAGGGPNERRSR